MSSCAESSGQQCVHVHMWYKQGFVRISLLVNVWSGLLLAGPVVRAVAASSLLSCWIWPAPAAVF